MRALRRRSSGTKLRLARMIHRFGNPNNVSPFTIFGLFAMTAMLVFYAFEKRMSVVHFGIRLFLLARIRKSFLQGAWPFGILSSSGLALRCDFGG
jgi:hypothetical protein